MRCTLVNISGLLLGLSLVGGSSRAQDVTAVRFTPDGKHVIAAGLDGNVRRIEARTGKEVSVAKGHPGGVFALVLDADGKLAASGGADNKIILWDLAELKHHKEWTTGAQVLALSFSANGKQIAAGGTDGVRVWDIGLAKELRSVKPASHAVTAVAMLPDDRIVHGGVTSRNFAGAMRVREDDSAGIWQGDPLKEIRTLAGKFSRLVVSDDGRLLAGGGYGMYVGKAGGAAAIVINGVAANMGQKVCLWDLDANRELWQGADLGLEVALSPDGRWLAVGQGRHLHLSKGAGGSIIFGGRNAAVPVRLLETATGKEILQLPYVDISALAFSPDATRLAIGKLHGGVSIAELQPKDWKAPTAEQVTKPWLEKAWQDLGGEAPAAFRALCDLTAAGDPASAFIRERLPAVKLDREQIQKDLQDLDSDHFPTRAAASKRLRRLGLDAEAALQRGLDQAKGQEARRRLDLLLNELRSAALPPIHLQASRALLVLERQGTQTAREALHQIASGAADAWLTRQATRSRERVKRMGQQYLR